MFTMGLGQVYSLQGNYKGAIVAYQKAIELGIVNSFWTHKNLEDALKAEHRIEEAESWKQRASDSQDIETEQNYL